MKVKSVLVVGIIVIVAVGAVLFIQRGLIPKGEPATLTVRLGWLHQSQFAGFYVAQEKGYYEDAGLTVELLELDEDIDQVTELSRNDVDVSVMEAHQVLEGVGNGADIKAVMVVYQINPHALAARVDSGIKSPEDFAGKVIGLAGGEGEGNALFPIFIERFGNADSVTYKKLGFNTVDDFVQKRADVIDVYRIDQPYLAEQVGVPLTVIPLDAYGFSTYGDVIVMNQQLISARPDVVKRFVKASQKGWEDALKNPEETIDVVLPYTSGAYTDAAYQRHIIQQSVPLVRGLQNDLGRMELVSWSTLYESMRSAEVLNSDFDVTKVYTNDFL